MSRLQDLLTRALGLKGVLEELSRALFTLLAWLFALEALIPWWETWKAEPSGPVRAGTTALTIVFIATYYVIIFRVFYRRRSWSEIFTVREGRILRAITGAISITMTLWFGGLWSVLLVFATITFVLTARPVAANTAALQAIVVVTVVLLLSPVEPPILVTVLASTLIFSLMIAAQARQGGIIGQMIESRYTERRMAAAEERLRIARDLHDVLGHTLSLITLKSELANRLLDAEPERARQEIREVEQLARSAMGDARRAVSEERHPILAVEIGDARQLLSAAGIEAEIDGDPAAFPEEIASLFAWGVREGVTNVVRHSRAGRCMVRLWHDGNEARLSVADDGVANGLPNTGRGTGIANLRRRAESLGGTVAFEVVPDEAGHRLCLTVPLPLSGME